MTNETSTPKLPVEIAEAVTAIAHGLIPSSVKALNRLIGAAVEIPAAYLERFPALIRAKTQAHVAVDEAVGKRAAALASGDDETVARAMNILLRKEYRKLGNREAVAIEFLEDLRSEAQADATNDGPPVGELDDDWLNAFERFAEDASTERMQKLWGRVLAGEVRKPGRFSIRSLRCLSEFSQKDALAFADLCENSFGGIAPNALIKPEDVKDISGLLNLEAAGLLNGASGFGLSYTIEFDQWGNGFLGEDNLTIQFRGEPKASFVTSCCSLTTLGRELTYLLPMRDQRAVARKVAVSMKQAQTTSALLAYVDAQSRAIPLETLWDKPPA